MHAAASPGSSQRRWTVLEVLRWTTARFTKQGMDSPRLDAELLAAQAFGLSRVELYTHFDSPLDEAELASYRGFTRRRLAGEPVAYICGRKEFWSLDLQVDGRVLIPRPDTETLVEQALDFVRARTALEGASPMRIADVGTGSGALALALKKECPQAEIFALDISPDALAVARANAEQLGLPITFLLGDLVEPLVELPPFDLVVSNPPYIPSKDILGLSAEVRCEPRLALDGGEDGLALFRRIATSAAQVLAPEGKLALEVGAGQADPTAQILRDARFTAIGTRRDLAGIERVVFAQRGQ